VIHEPLLALVQLRNLANSPLHFEAKTGEKMSLTCLIMRFMPL